MLGVGRRDTDENRRERRDTERGERRPIEMDRCRPDARDEQFHERVHDRDALTAAAATSAQRRPAHEWNVLEPGELIAALRAARTRAQDRTFARPADDADVQERTDASADEEGVQLPDEQRDRHRLSS